MSMFFGDWLGLLRTIAVGIPVYLAMVLLLRLAGKRALAKLNAYGLIVTVALGSTVASTLLTQNVQLAEGLLAIALLLVLQFAIAWAVIRFPAVQRLVTQKPRMLLYRGKLLPEEMRAERITREEVEAAARSSGRMSLGAVHAVVLETDGSFSVISDEDQDCSAFQSIGNFPPEKS